MKIAVVGTGISSLAASYALCDQHELTLFDAAAHIGGHTNTIDLQIGDEHRAIDTGFIVFSRANYPNFCRLIDELNVESQPTSMSFSVRCDQTGLEYNGGSLNGMFAQRRNLLRPRFYRMIREIIRFGQVGPKLLTGETDAITVKQYVARERFSDAFVKHYLVPLGASLWSCPADSFLNFPIRFVVDFLHNHQMLQVNAKREWRVIKGGSKQYMKPLTRKFADRIHLRTPVRSVRRSLDDVTLTFASGEQQRFDHVILGCHADTAMRLLGDDATPAERELLGVFPYQKNVAILHTDTSVLPKRKLAWASWNYRINPRSDRQATVTYDMNILQSLKSKHEFLVTLDDESSIDPEKIIQKIDYEHPIYTAGRSAAQSRHGELAASNRTSFCGAYWGFGFHEDGVRSGFAVAKAIGQGAWG